MNYPYTQANLLEQPHSYMYTSFKGESLLHDYHANRLEVMKKLSMMESTTTRDIYGSSPQCLRNAFESVSSAAGSRFLQLIQMAGQGSQGRTAFADEGFERESILLSEFSTGKGIATFDLLDAVIQAQLSGQFLPATKEWLDRLVQRFEVTKKIFEIYPPGFRKGEGDGRSVKLYWLFALSLTLHYVNSLEIKYLSTLLKVCDLLCSLPVTLHPTDIPAEIKSSILAAEVVSFEMLASQKGIRCD